MGVPGDVIDVPNQKFSSSQDGYSGIKIDLQIVLEGHQVLGCTGGSRVHVAHPVSASGVIHIEHMVKTSICGENLSRKGEEQEQGGREEDIIQSHSFNFGQRFPEPLSQHVAMLDGQVCI